MPKDQFTRRAGHGRLAVWALAVSVSVALAVIAAERGTQTQKQTVSPERRLLPDYSEGMTGLLGPFVWSRAMDMGGDARFCDESGRPDPNGRFVWLYQFMRLRRRSPRMPLIHERNNLVSSDPRVAYEVQPWDIRLNCPRAHNFKLIFGYMDRSFRFQHGDNCDLAHLAGGDRVCVFLPIRLVKDHDPRPVTDQQRYMISPFHAAQSVCIIEWKAGEMIHYRWFANRDRLDRHILFDLAPYFDADRTVYPGVTKPLFRFTIDGKGGWEVRIERDGRDGLEGGQNDGDWDMTFTHKSPGARPYTVNVTGANSTWAVSTFSPGGEPEESSEAVVGLRPFDRGTGKPTAWADRKRRYRTFRLDELDRVLAGEAPGRLFRRGK
jgi:hypothetical protein